MENVLLTLRLPSECPWTVWSLEMIFCCHFFGLWFRLFSVHAPKDHQWCSIGPKCIIISSLFGSRGHDNSAEETIHILVISRDQFTINISSWGPLKARNTIGFATVHTSPLRWAVILFFKTLFSELSVALNFRSCQLFRLYVWNPSHSTENPNTRWKGDNLISLSTNSSYPQEVCRSALISVFCPLISGSAASLLENPCTSVTHTSY